MDTFIEKIVAKRKDFKDHLFSFGIIIAAFIGVIAVFNIPLINTMGWAFAAGIVYLAFRFITSRNVEFEYIVTNGDLDIDKIISQRKRKRIFSANCKEFEALAKVKSSHYGQHIESINSKIIAVSSMESENVYFVTLSYKGEKTVVYFEPDERMLKNFKLFIPSKMHI